VASAIVLETVAYATKRTPPGILADAGGAQTPRTGDSVSVDAISSPRNAIPPTDRVLVSEDDAAVLLSLSKPTMRKFVAMGLIARVEMPVGTRRNLYAVDELRAFASRLARTSDVRTQPVKVAS